MFRYSPAVAVLLLLVATAVTNVSARRASDVGASPVGTSSHDVMPSAGGGVELHACRGVNEDGPYNIVEFGRGAAGDASGVQLIMDEVAEGSCAHLVVFTQPEPTQAL